MSSTSQPYINDGIGTDFYNPTTWLDEVTGVQDGTPVDQEHLNNMESGIFSNEMFLSIITELLHGTRQDQKEKNEAFTARMDKIVSALKGQVITVNLTNTGEDMFCNNSAKVAAFGTNMSSTDYWVVPEIQGDTVNVGDIVIYDKQLNGCKVKYTGTAKSVTVVLYVHERLAI